MSARLCPPKGWALAEPKADGTCRPALGAAAEAEAVAGTKAEAAALPNMSAPLVAFPVDAGTSVLLEALNVSAGTACELCLAAVEEDVWGTAVAGKAADACLLAGADPIPKGPMPGPKLAGTGPLTAGAAPKPKAPDACLLAGAAPKPKAPDDCLLAGADPKPKVPDPFRLAGADANPNADEVLTAEADAEAALAGAPNAVFPAMPNGGRACELADDSPPNKEAGVEEDGWAAEGEEAGGAADVPKTLLDGTPNAVPEEEEREDAGAVRLPNRPLEGTPDGVKGFDPALTSAADPDDERVCKGWDWKRLAVCDAAGKPPGC